VAKTDKNGNETTLPVELLKPLQTILDSTGNGHFEVLSNPEF
jgi:hypothetical protein